VHHPRSIVSKQALLEHLYDYNWERHSNVIEAHISNLRRKLSSPHTESCIETLRGRGYRLAIPSPRLSIQENTTAATNDAKLRS
jgi:two-component system response regulator PhoP